MWWKTIYVFDLLFHSILSNIDQQIQVTGLENSFGFVNFILLIFGQGKTFVMFVRCKI